MVYVIFPDAKEILLQGLIDSLTSQRKFFSVLVFPKFNIFLFNLIEYFMFLIWFNLMLGI